MEAIMIIGVLFLLSKLGGGDSRKTRPDGSHHWGDVEPPEWFEGADNSLWISPTCDAVSEGKDFFPFDWATKDTRAEEAATLDATLQLAPDNTALGYIDHLMAQGITDPLVIAQRMLSEAGPMCAAVDESEWSPAVSAWYASLVKRTTDYVTQDTIG